MIIIDANKCIGCSKCAADCFSFAIDMKNGKAVHSGRRCMECGHCVAICPQNAVTMDNYDMSEVLEFEGLEQSIDADTYLNHLKARRTIRKFKDIPVTEEEIRKIIEAGRFSPTGGNHQGVTYYVAHNDIQTLKDMVYEELNRVGQESEKTGKIVSGYERLWLRMYQEYKATGVDKLFFDADTVILISSPAPIEACIAAAHMETMVYSMGLGMLYSGFTTRAIANAPKIKKYIQLPDGKNVHAVLVIGHPKPEYVRTVPRKKADIIWG